MLSTNITNWCWQCVKQPVGINQTAANNIMAKLNPNGSKIQTELKI